MESNQKELIRQRIRTELQLLSTRGNVKAELITQGDHDFVLYYGLKTSGGSKKLPEVTDVLVAVPEGYPAALIDMPALEVESSLIPFVVGGNNPQNIVTVVGKEWRFLSFHPYSGDGAPHWNPNKHGFHDYYQHLYTWLNRI